MAYESPTEQFNRQARLRQILEGWRQHPGRAPGGTGATGLLSNDARGWSQMLNEQTEALGLMRGRAPMVRFGGYPDRPDLPSTIGVGQTSANPATQAALEGLQSAYAEEENPRRKQQIASRFQERFPFYR